MKNTPYIHSQVIHNTKAAEVVLPIIQLLVDFKSVVDFGCGLGSWLCVAEKLGAERIVGVDGSYVPRELLYIDEKAFCERDLRQPLEPLGSYDLAICLEVAEHLPFAISDDIVRFLSQSANNILFSAAIPQQTGQNHINEQWPEFWAQKFRKAGFLTYDFLRPMIWQDESIEWWYKQNIFFLSKNNYHKNGFAPVSVIQPLVHPENYADKIRRLTNYQNGNISLKSALGVLFKKLVN